MFSVIVGILFLSDVYPLARAWRAQRRTTLFQTIHWVIAACLLWSLLAWVRWSAEDAALVRYLALCLTGCACVAVLGARRPGVGPWNFVLLGLLAVLLLPVAEGFFLGGLHLAGPRTLFLAATLAMIAINYLPTRAAPTALLAVLGGTLQLLLLAEVEAVSARAALLEPVSLLMLATVPWTALERFALRPPPRSEFDRTWLDFRDTFGFVWSQRVREQFNNAAAHAGWPVVLRWPGLRILPEASLPDETTQEAMLAALQALLKRFRTGEEETAS